MMTWTWRIFAVSLSFLFFGLIVSNGIYMLSAPRKWLESGAWFVNKGSSRTENFRTNSSLVQLRIVGAVFAVAGICALIEIAPFLLKL